MNMQKQNAKSELTAGLFVLVGLVLFGLLILKFGDFKHWTRKKYGLVVSFEQAGTLIKNAPVRSGGVEIGRVGQDPFLVKGLTGVKVPLMIYREYYLAEGSEWHIKMDGLMGDAFVDVVPPKQPTGRMIPEESELEGESHGDLSSSASMVADDARVTMQELQKTLSDIRNGLGKLLSEGNLGSVEGALSEMKSATGKINNEVLAAGNLEQVKLTLEELRQTTARLGKAAENAETLLGTAEKSITTKIEPGIEEFSKAMASFRKTADSLGLVSGDIRTSSGVLPALIKDPKLKEDLAALFSNLRRNGVLFYKDDFSKLQQQATTPAQKPERKGIFGR